MLKFGDEMQYLPFVISLDDNIDNELNIRIALAWRGTAVSPDTGNSALDDILSKAVPVYPDPDNIYDICFSDYILYQVRNESYCCLGSRETKIGKGLVIYSRSFLLDHLSESTLCVKNDEGSSFPGDWVHYGIHSENHVIDIISCSEPIISKVL